MTPRELARPLPFNQVRESTSDDAEALSGQVMDEVADQINAGAMGPDVTASRRKAR